MVIRYIKIDFVLIISLMCLIYAGQNVTNLDACYQAFAYVMSMADHQAYPDSFFPVIQNPALIWLATILVVSLEFAGGLLAAKGAWDLWSARKAPAPTFNAAKTYALLGCATGFVVWMGFFIVVAGGLFQMWQTDIGAASMNDAYKFAGACAFVFLIVNMADD